MAVTRRVRPRPVPDRLAVRCLDAAGTHGDTGGTVFDLPPPEEPLHIELLEELAAAGVAATRISEVKYVRRLPDGAITVLVRHLDLPHQTSTLSEIVRCLADRDARKHQLSERFLEAFIAGACRQWDPLQESLAVALAVHATKHVIPELLYAIQRPGNERYLGHLLGYFRRNGVREIGPVLDAVAATIDPRDVQATLVLAGAMADIGWPEGLGTLKARRVHVKGKRAEKLDALIARLEILAGAGRPDQVITPPGPWRP